MPMDKLPEIKTGYAGIHHLLFAGYLPKILNAAIDAGVFEALARGPMKIDDLAETLETEPAATAALCRILADVSLLEKDKDRYTLPPMSREFLVAGSPVNQLLDIKKYQGASGPFDPLEDVLKGRHKPEFNNEMWASKESLQAMAQGARAGVIQAVVNFVTGLPEFKNLHKMCDLAGNSGHFAQALTRCGNGLQAHVYDLPKVISIARQLQEGGDQDLVSFHPFDMDKDDDFGRDYDLFFISHFLYKCGGEGALPDFFKRVNRAMIPGGVFVSNHISDTVPTESRLTMDMVELLTMCMGYPTHHLPLETLKQALEQSGFGEFTIREPEPGPAYPALLLAARKIREI